ncbi:hypothetical protein ACFL23_04535 [Patescibacteria group bacterium]
MNKIEKNKIYIEDRNLKYYPVTEGELNNLRGVDIWASLILAFAGIILGWAGSYNGDKKFFYIGSWVVGGLLFIIAIFLFFKKRGLIKKITEEGLTIIRAEWKSENKTKDVKRILKKYVGEDNTLSIPASTDFLGEINEGHKKTLKILYRINKKVEVKEFKEDSQVNLSFVDPASSAG